jgi:hypothetical protein
MNKERRQNYMDLRPHPKPKKSLDALGHRLAFFFFVLEQPAHKGGGTILNKLHPTLCNAIRMMHPTVPGTSAWLALVTVSLLLVTDLSGVDVSGTQWEGYNVLYCGLTPTTYGAYLPDALLQLIAQKGFSVTQSCNMAALLSYPRFHVFILIDRTESVVISDADAAAVAAFYVRGGGAGSTR